MILNTKNNATLLTAQAVLLDASSLTLAQAHNVLRLACGKGTDDADLYFEHTVSEGWSLEEGRVKSGSFSIDHGVGVRVVRGEKTAFAYSDDISLQALRDASKSVQAGGKPLAKAKALKTKYLYFPFWLKFLFFIFICFLNYYLWFFIIF